MGIQGLALLCAFCASCGYSLYNGANWEEFIMRKSLTILLTLVPFIALAGFTLAQQKKAPAEVQTANVTANAQGYQPASIDLKANVPAKITFVRQSNDTCATEVVIPDYNIKKDLPLNKPVDVEFTPTKAGTVNFACGMNMFRGKLVVK